MTESYNSMVVTKVLKYFRLFVFLNFEQSTSHCGTKTDKYLAWTYLNPFSSNIWIVQEDIIVLYSIAEFYSSRCSKPDVFAGKSLFNVTAHMACEDHASKSSVALAVAIPIIIICCVLIGYYAYKIIQNKKKGQRKSVRYSAVYKDTVESTKFRPTSDIWRHKVNPQHFC